MSDTGEIAKKTKKTTASDSVVVVAKALTFFNRDRARDGEHSRLHPANVRLDGQTRRGRHLRAAVNWNQRTDDWLYERDDGF